MELEEIHNCESCRGKIVCISVDMFGNTFCGYCGQQVDYRPYYAYYDNLYKEDMLQIINDLKKEESTWQIKKKKKRKKDRLKVIQ